MSSIDKLRERRKGGTSSLDRLRQRRARDQKKDPQDKGGERPALPKKPKKKSGNFGKFYETIKKRNYIIPVNAFQMLVGLLKNHRHELNEDNNFITNFGLDPENLREVLWAIIKTIQEKRALSKNLRIKRADIAELIANKKSHRILFEDVFGFSMRDNDDESEMEAMLKVLKSAEYEAIGENFMDFATKLGDEILIILHRILCEAVKRPSTMGQLQIAENLFFEKRIPIAFPLKERLFEIIAERQIERRREIQDTVQSVQPPVQPPPADPKPAQVPVVPAQPAPQSEPPPAPQPPASPTEPSMPPFVEYHPLAPPVPAAPEPAPADAVETHRDASPDEGIDAGPTDPPPPPPEESGGELDWFGDKPKNEGGEAEPTPPPPSGEGSPDEHRGGGPAQAPETLDKLSEAQEYLRKLLAIFEAGGEEVDDMGLKIDDLLPEHDLGLALITVRDTPEVETPEDLLKEVFGCKGEEDSKQRTLEIYNALKNEIPL